MCTTGAPGVSSIRFLMTRSGSTTRRRARCTAASLRCPKSSVSETTAMSSNQSPRSMGAIAMARSALPSAKSAKSVTSVGRSPSRRRKSSRWTLRPGVSAVSSTRAELLAAKLRSRTAGSRARWLAARSGSGRPAKSTRWRLRTASGSSRTRPYCASRASRSVPVRNSAVGGRIGRSTS